MIKNPIQEVTNKLQYRAIGIVNGIYNPNDQTQLNRGTLTDKEGTEIETVVLGKAISLIKKYVDLKKSYYWIVYPKIKILKICIFKLLGFGILLILMMKQK